MFAFTLNPKISRRFVAKEGGLYYMGGTYIFFLHPKWSKLCTVPLMGPKNPPTKKKKIFLTSYLVPLKKWFFARFTLFLGVRKYFFFIQNVANFAQPLLWILRTPLFKKNHKTIFSTSYLDLLKMWLFCSFYAFTGGS
jgi:hypothetical protein